MTWRRNATEVACTVLCCAFALQGQALQAQTIERAEALWRAHDYEGANNAFKALVAAQPKNANYRVRWGQLFYERFNPGEAQKLYEEALGIDPKNANALLGEAQ